MAKGNLKVATRELVEQATEILDRTKRARREADALFDTLKRMNEDLNRAKEEENARRRREEQMKVQSSYAKAFTMLDEDEKAQMEAARKQRRPRRKSPRRK